MVPSELQPFEWIGVSIEMVEGTWGAFEIRLGANQIDVAENLLRINANIEKADLQNSFV